MPFVALEKFASRGHEDSLFRCLPDPEALLVVCFHLWICHLPGADCGGPFVCLVPRYTPLPGVMGRSRPPAFFEGLGRLKSFVFTMNFGINLSVFTK